MDSGFGSALGANSDHSASRSFARHVFEDSIRNSLPHAAFHRELGTMLLSYLGGNPGQETGGCDASCRGSSLGRILERGASWLVARHHTE